LHTPGIGNVDALQLSQYSIQNYSLITENEHNGHTRVNAFLDK